MPIFAVNRCTHSSKPPNDCVHLPRPAARNVMSRKTVMPPRSGAMVGSPLTLPARNSSRAHDARTFHHVKLSAHDECIVTDLRFVHESNRRMCTATRGNGVIRAVDKLDPQVFAVATTDPKLRPVVGRTI